MNETEEDKMFVNLFVSAYIRMLDEETTVVPTDIAAYMLMKTKDLRQKKKMMLFIILLYKYSSVNNVCI